MAAKKRTAGKRKAAQKRSTAPRKRAPVKKALQAAKRTVKRAVSKVKKALKKPAPKKGPVTSARRAKPVARKRSGAGSRSAARRVVTDTPAARPPPWLAPTHAPVDDLTSSGDELLDIFQRYDRDRSGKISRAEFARLLEALGQELSDDELEVALDVVDSDHSGHISWREFKAWWTSF